MLALSQLARACALVTVALSLAGCGMSPSRYQATNERECLARVMYFESNRSSDDGMLAVGTVVMNRLQSGRYPRTVCGVVGQTNQFAPGALSQPWGGRGQTLAYRMADAVMAGQRHAGVGGAMFFHTAGLTFPYRNMHYVVVAGGNAFYEKRSPAEMRALAALAPPPAPAPVRLAMATLPAGRPAAPILRNAILLPPAPQGPLPEGSLPEPGLIEPPAPAFDAVTGGGDLSGGESGGELGLGALY